MQGNRKSPRFWRAFVGACLIAVPVSAQMTTAGTPWPSQESARPDSEQSSSAEPSRLRPQAYGLQDTTIFQLSAWDFEGIDSTTTTSFDPVSRHRYVTGGASQLKAGVQLPSGALITQLEVAGCDNHEALDVRAELLRCDEPDGPCVLMFSAVSSGVPGCQFFSATNPGVTVDNANKSYLLQMVLGGASALRFRSVRIYYKLQLSPPPTVPRFSDVPIDHVFFQHIEALAAAGITSGCGGGNYCPNDPITRGQMAVFLARLVGLHWPN